VKQPVLDHTKLDSWQWQRSGLWCVLSLFTIWVFKPVHWHWCTVMRMHI